MTDENLYIKIENGEPVDFPISEKNLRILIPNLDPNNPPEEFARVVKGELPDLSNKVLDYVTYELSDSYTELNKTKTYIEVYHLKDSDSPPEPAVIVDNQIKTRPNQESYVYDKESGKLIPPVPKPDDGEEYVWGAPNTMIGETQGKWVKKSDVVSYLTPEAITVMINNITQYGQANNIPEEIIQKMIEEVKTSDESQVIGKEPS